MARLEHWEPLVQRSRDKARHALADPRVSVRTSDEERLTYVVKGDSFKDEGEDGLLVSLVFEGEMLQAATVKVGAKPSPVIVQRFNRLFSDLQGELLWYHRTAQVHYHLPGQWLDLPVEVRWSPGHAITMEWRHPGDADWKDASAAVVRRTIAAAPRRPLGSPTAPARPASGTSAPPAPVAMSARHGDPRGLFKFPVLTKRSEVIVKADMAEDLNMVWETHSSGSREIVAVVGPTGTAKTSLAFNLAAMHGLPIMTFDAVGAREFSDWVGSTHLRGDRTEFVQSGFLQAIDADGPYAGQFRIVLVDEVNRAESTGSLNALVPILHDYASIFVPELGRAVAVDPAVMFVLTANRGTEYGGTIGLDRALVDRVTSWFRMDYLEHEAERGLVVARTGLGEQQADRLCSAARRVREAAGRGELPEGGGISTRSILTAAVKATRGMTLQRAAALSWLGAYSDEGGSSSESQVVKSAIDAVLRGL